MQIKSAAFLIKTFVSLSLTEVVSFVILLWQDCSVVRGAFWFDSEYTFSIAEQNGQIVGLVSAIPAAAWRFGVATIPAAAVGTALMAWVLRRQVADRYATRSGPSANGPRRGDAVRTNEVSALADTAATASNPESDDSTLRERLLDVAHELRNPLTVMRGQLDAFEDGIRRPDNAALSVLRHAVHQFDALLVDMESLASGELRGLPCRRMVSINLGKLLEALLQDYEQSLTQRGLTLELALDANCEMQGDPERLRQAFSNLVQNSLRYTQPHGVIRIGLRKEANGLRLTWEDSAPGVIPAQMQALGQRGFRTSDATMGRGLGLSIVQAIVEAHGGGMRPEASELGGLRWHVWLPANTPESAT
jgi:two-component system sensor histidine kinase BaeS